MHHKRSKMKPEEELPSPGAVSIQVRKVDLKETPAISFNIGCLTVNYVWANGGRCSRKRELDSSDASKHRVGLSAPRFCSPPLRPGTKAAVFLLLSCSPNRAG